MADISTEVEVTLTDGNTSVNIIVTPRIVHNWDKPNMTTIPLPYIVNNMVSTTIVDLGMNKFLIKFDGIIRDDATTTAETRLTNLYTLFNSQSNVYISWGSNTTSISANGSTIYQNDNNVTKGSIFKVEIREVVGRTSTDSSSRQRAGTYSKTYEVTIAFLVGDIMVV